MEVGSCLGGDGGEELLRRRWRWGAVEKRMEMESC